MALAAIQLPAMAWPAHGAPAMAWPTSRSRRRIAGNWITIYGGDFGKYVHVLYVFANKWTRIVYFG
jgi:hypothetical protein